MADSDGACWVFHQGALGDSLLLWPMLRATAKRGRRIVLVTDRSKAALAAHELGIEAMDAEQRRFNDLWLPDARIEVIQDVGKVIAFTGATPAEHDVWIRNVQRMFPRASLQLIPGRPDAIRARQWSQRPYQGMPPLRRNPDGPIICHIGAGSEKKRWPLDSFLQLAQYLADAGLPALRFIAGEVEAERLTPDDTAAFEAASGRFIADLAVLAGTLRGACLVIGNDSGPMHLAAQLGVPVLSLFGPTDAGRWGPVGPLVRVLAPPAPCGMDWLPVDVVVAEAHHVLTAAAARRASSAS